MSTKTLMYIGFAIFAVGALVAIIAGAATGNGTTLATGIVVLLATVVLYLVWRWDIGASKRRKVST